MNDRWEDVYGNSMSAVEVIVAAWREKKTLVQYLKDTYAYMAETNGPNSGYEIGLYDSNDFHHFAQQIREDAFGEVEFDNRKIVLKEQAYPTSRVLTEYADNGRYENSNVYEYEASGQADDGSAVLVRWHFRVAKEDAEVEDGAYSYETLEEDYDWDNVYDVKPDPNGEDF